MKKIYLVLISISFLALCMSFVSSARLPTVGGDDGAWGTVLNTFLNISHNASGQLKANTVSTSQITDGAIVDADISDTTNLTLGEKITFAFGEIIDNIVDGWIAITGSLSISGNLNMTSGNITDVNDPTNPQDVATKKYVDDNAGGMWEVSGTSAQLKTARDIDLQSKKIILRPTITIDTTSNNMVFNVPAGGVYDFNVHRLTEVSDPTEDQDVATKKYVDDSHTKEFWLPVLARNWHGSSYEPYYFGDEIGQYTISNMDASSGVYTSCSIPEDYTGNLQIYIRMIPDATETIQMDLYTDFAGDGETYNTNSNSSLDFQKAVTQNKITEILIADIGGTGSILDVTGISAGDHMGLRVDSDTNALKILGFRIKYD